MDQSKQASKVQKGHSKYRRKMVMELIADASKEKTSDPKEKLDEKMFGSAYNQLYAGYANREKFEESTRLDDFPEALRVASSSPTLETFDQVNDAPDDRNTPVASRLVPTNKENKSYLTPYLMHPGQETDSPSSSQSDEPYYRYAPHKDAKAVKIQNSRKTTESLRPEIQSPLEGQSPNTSPPLESNTLSYSLCSDPARCSQEEESRKILNILLLGESGAGKTTFINNFVNSLDHSMLETMLQNEPKVLKDMDFTVSDEAHNVIRVKAETNLVNREICESKNTEESLTKSPTAYHVSYSDDEGQTKMLNLIYTPGVNDEHTTMDSDENIDEIIKIVNRLGELHAVCILLKPCQARFSTAFQTHMERLLARLPREMLRNFLFCFTEPSSIFTVDYTLNTLRTFLEHLKEKTGVMITVDGSNVFRFDNDCIRFVLALKKGVYHGREEAKIMFSESWKRNVDESKRFINQAGSLFSRSFEDASWMPSLPLQSLKDASLH